MRYLYFILILCIPTLCLTLFSYTSSKECNVVYTQSNLVFRYRFVVHPTSIGSVIFVLSHFTHVDVLIGVFYHIVFLVDFLTCLSIVVICYIGLLYVYCS